jgi:hypothetical protein
MLKGPGNDIFENDIFDWYSWSADILQSPEEARNRFNSLNLRGKIISDITSVGYAYNLEEYRLAENCHRFAEIDHPMVISFDDGDRLEIEFSEGSSVRISKNCLPKGIKPSIIFKNFDAARLFSPCLGQELVDIEVTTTDTYPEFTGSFGMTLDEEKSDYIETVILLLSHGLKLKFEAFYDYGWVTATDEMGAPLKINFKDLKQALLNHE